MMKRTIKIRTNIIFIGLFILSSYFIPYIFFVDLSVSAIESNNNSMNVTLDVDKAIYGHGMIVYITLAAAPEIIKNFTILGPERFSYAILPSNKGEYEFMPDSPGKYIINVSLDNGSQEKFLTAEFEVADFNLVIEFGEPEHERIAPGRSVNWSQGIFAANPMNFPVSDFPIDIPLPHDYSNLVSDSGFTINNTSVLIDLAPGKSMNFTISYQTSPVMMDVSVDQINILDLIPKDTFDIALYREIEAGVPQLTMNSNVSVKRLLVWHNSTISYRNIPINISIVEGEKVFEFMDGSINEISASIQDGTASFIIPELHNRTFFFIMAMEQTQGKAKINEPVEWELSISGMIIKYKMIGFAGSNALNPANLEKLKIKEVEKDVFAFKSESDDIIVIGEENDTSPQPYLKLDKWEGEVTLKVAIPQGKKGKKTLDKNKLNWSNNEYEVSFYPKEPETFVEEIGDRNFTVTTNDMGGVEFDLVLKKKPQTNIFEFPIETQGLDFYYQPPLHPQHPTWSDENGDGKPDTFQPENVVGSFSVYHKTKKDHILGETDYKTGKAFHIYRPKVIDAARNEIWGILNMDEMNKILTVTIDKAWLESAIYPVTIDPTFGYTTGGVSFSCGANNIQGSNFTGASGTLGMISAWAYDDSTSHPKFKPAMYLHSDSSFVAEGAEITGTLGTFHWYNHTVSGSPSISAVEYVLVGWGSGPFACGPNYDAGVTNQGHTQSLTYGTWPNPANFSHNNNKYSIYATYTAGGGAVTYNLSGYVTNASSGVGLSGATVQTNTSLSTTTNASGFYNFTGLSNGTYIINASFAGYTTNSINKTINGANITNANTSLSPTGGIILVATNRYVILDDPNTGTAGPGGFTTGPGFAWTNWTGKNTQINATALYIDNSGTPISNEIISFTLFWPNGTALTTVYNTTNSLGLANFSYDLNGKNYYGKWNISASTGTITDRANFIYNWWGCDYSDAKCSGMSSSMTPPTGTATANSPYLSRRDNTVNSWSSHYAGTTNCTYCHQSYDGLADGSTLTGNHTNKTSDVHRNLTCDNVNCHGNLTTHRTNELIYSCFNTGCHGNVSAWARNDLSNKSTLNSSTVASALSLYSINGTAFNATFHTPNSSVPCIICHGPMHNITNPNESQRFMRNNNTEDSQCITCHSTYKEHNLSNMTSGGVNCTLCHSDDVHAIKVFAQNATYVNLNKGNPNTYRGNCTNCHQNASFFPALQAQPMAGRYTGRNPPQVTLPLEHSNDPSAGTKWNQTPGYWSNSNQLIWCQYCHGNTTHNITALGRPSQFDGNNTVNSTISTSSSWCASCHWQGYTNGSNTYNNMVSTFTREVLPVPPEITGNATYGANQSNPDYFNHTSVNKDDSTCKSCHGSLSSGITYITGFMHNVALDISPQYSLNQTNSTGAGQSVLFSLYWTDNNALAGYIFSFDNGTGTFSNNSYAAMTGTGNWSNVTKTLNSTVGSTIRWRVYANDTSGNMNASSNFSFNTTDSILPQIDFVSPTPDDGNITSNNFTYINVTVSDVGTPNNLTSFIDWNRSLVGWWRFNYESGENDTIARDWSTYANDGTISNMNQGMNNCTGNCSGWTTSGKFGNALNFDGVNDYVNAGNDTSLNIPTNMSLFSWVKFNNVTKMQYIIGQAGTFNISQYALRISSGKINVIWSNKSYSSNATIQKDAWYHIGFTRSGTAGNWLTKIYINGTLDNTTNSIFDPGNGSIDVNIGRGTGSSSYNLNGSIDEVQIWNRVLSPEEINASYNTGLYRLYHNFTNLSQGNYTYTAYAQDLAGNVNQTETRTLTITGDITPPQYSLNQTNSTGAGQNILFSLYWTDNNALAGYIFSFDNGTGTFSNNSYAAMTGTGNWSNVTKTLNSTVGATIRWRVYANDTSGNMNASEVFSFITANTIPDFQITNITFIYIGDTSDVSETGTGDLVRENANVTVNATVHNYGGDYTENPVYVGFYDGKSGQIGRQFANITLRNATGGTHILQNTDSYSVGYWNPSLAGTHNISVWADWTNVTWENSTANETNNNNSRFVNVTAWQKYWGNVSGNVALASSSGNRMYQWAWSNATDIGYIYFANSGIPVNWTSLHGVGSDRDNDLNTSGNDFYEADTALNLKSGIKNATGFLNNNITQLFCSSGSNNATNTTYFIVRGTNITNVPIVNSTNMTDHRNVVNANFITGLFWDQDSGSGVDYYDGSQNLIFAGKVRPHTSGLPGVTQVHNYEVAIPSALNATIGGNIEFYVELK